MNWVDTRGAERAARVVIVSRRLDIGGTEKHIAQILPELRRRGIDASLFVLERGGALESPLAASGPRGGGGRMASFSPPSQTSARHRTFFSS